MLKSINMKKKIMLGLASIPLLASTNTMVGTDPSSHTPKYLSVDKFKECLGSQSVGSAKILCLPDTKPAKCPQESWDKLQNMSIPKCKS